LTRPPIYVPVLFMLDAPTAASPETQPSRVGRLLALVRRLIDYGRDLAAKVQRSDPATDIRHFDTSDISLILARITRACSARRSWKSAWSATPPASTPRAGHRPHQPHTSRV
jgi:hypothetical protein